MAIAGGAFAQSEGNFQFGSKAFRIPVLRADPWVIKAQLEGNHILAPEMSTIIGFSGLGGAAGAAAGAASAANTLIKNGTLVVNPTDNSLWWFPKPKG